jgi:hypothetical protein
MDRPLSWNERVEQEEALFKKKNKFSKTNQEEMLRTWEDKLDEMKQEEM